MKLVKKKQERLIPNSCSESIYYTAVEAGKLYYNDHEKCSDYKSYINKIIENGDLHLLEHCVIYLEIYEPWNALDYDTAGKYVSEKHSFVIGPVYDKTDNSSGSRQYSTAYITTNLRVLVENNWLDDLKYYSCIYGYNCRQMFTMKFVGDDNLYNRFNKASRFTITTTNEDYLDKSENITFTIPKEYEKKIKEDAYFLDAEANKPISYKYPNLQYKEPINSMLLSLLNAEKNYFDLIDNGLDEKYARGILPKYEMKEFIVTGYEDDWIDFFEKNVDLDKDNPLYNYYDYDNYDDRKNKIKTIKTFKI